jgi:hypothetical protein
MRRGILDLSVWMGRRIRLLGIMIEKGNRNGSKDFLSSRINGVGSSETTSSSKGDVLIGTPKFWLSRLESRRRLRSGDFWLNSLGLLGGIGLGMGGVALFFLISSQFLWIILRFEDPVLFS